MNISGDNIILYKDANIEISKTKEYRITGEKIVEMFENHKKTFSYYFAEYELYTHYDILTIFQKNNIIWYDNNLINYNLAQKLNIPKYSMIEKCAYVQTIWTVNYYHFLIDELPNIIKINQFNKDLPILCNYNDTYIKEILDLFNFSNELIKPKNNLGIKIKECILTNMAISGKPSKTELLLIRNYLIKEKKIEFNQMNLGIIIKRKEQERKVLNFDLIVEHLINKFKDIEWIVFDSLSFKDSVKLFSKSKYIIAPHGAGLTNMLFAPPECNIIEFMPYSDPNECYCHLANMLDHNYSCIVVNDTGKQNGKQMTIQLEYLDKIMNSLNYCT